MRAFDFLNERSVLRTKYITQFFFEKYVLVSPFKIEKSVTFITDDVIVLSKIMCYLGMNLLIVNHILFMTL